MEEHRGRRYLSFALPPRHQPKPPETGSIYPVFPDANCLITGQGGTAAAAVAHTRFRARATKTKRLCRDLVRQDARIGQGGIGDSVSIYLGFVFAGALEFPGSLFSASEQCGERPVPCTPWAVEVDVEARRRLLTRRGVALIFVGFELSRTRLPPRCFDKS